MSNLQSSRKARLSRKKPLKRRSKLKKVSSKQKGRMEKYYAIRNEWIKSRIFCEICGFNFATDVHHRKSRRGNLLFDTRWWMALCRTCHSEKVHGDVANAKKMAFALVEMNAFGDRVS